MRKRRRNNWVRRQWQGLSDRWRARSPKVFRRITNIGLAVSGVALAIQTALTAAGAMAPIWWCNVYPYLIGVPAGMAAVAKFTKEDEKQPKTQRQPRAPRQRKKAKPTDTKLSNNLKTGKD